jgi:hypothetical protein
MNLHDWCDMDKKDDEIKQCLKSWINKHPPPANGRARLLGAAISSKASVLRPATLHFSQLPNPIFSWTMVYSLENGVSALRMVS